MISGAVKQWLEAGGISPVLVGGFGDYVATAGPVFVVNDSPGADSGATYGDTAATVPYDAQVQIRCRAADVIAAVEGLRSAYTRLHAAKGATLVWSNPKGGTRSYAVMRVANITRPTWFPTPGAGEAATSNYRLRVRDA